MCSVIMKRQQSLDDDLAFTGTAASVSESNSVCVFIVHTLRVQGYDLALSVSTREYAEMSCARVWMSLVFCLFQDKKQNS